MVSNRLQEDEPESFNVHDAQDWIDAVLKLSLEGMRDCRNVGQDSHVGCRACGGSGKDRSQIPSGDHILEYANRSLNGFSTLSSILIKDITSVRHRISKYVEDDSLKRPFNIFLAATPGSGKSHFVRCLARSLSLPSVTGNLATPEFQAVLQFVVNEARNHKALDQLPFLFLDEIDSHDTLLPLLLPLLWDGELSVAGQVLRLGRCVIISAASRASWIDVSSDRDSSEIGRVISGEGKEVDFLSRINGGKIEVPSINSHERRSDRICIVLELIRRRFPYVRSVQLCFLQFVSELRFLHETRSLEYVLSSLPREVVTDGEFALMRHGPVTPKSVFGDMGGGGLRYHVADAGLLLKRWDQVVDRVGEVLALRYAPG